MMDMDDDPSDQETPVCVDKPDGCYQNDRLVIWHPEQEVTSLMIEQFKLKRQIVIE